MVPESMFKRSPKLSAESVVVDQERRKSQRIPVEATAMIESTNGTQRFTAQVVNVSEGGMRLKVRQQFERGSMIRIDLPCEMLGPVTTVLACVMNAAPEGDDVWSLGCTFCGELDDEDLKVMGVKREKPPVQKEMRSWTRYPIRAQVLYRNMSSTNQLPFSGEVINASPTGIGLRIKESLDPGTLLDLTIQNTSGQTLFAILACIVYRHYVEEETYTIGCNFIRELTEKELGAIN